MVWLTAWVWFSLTTEFVGATSVYDVYARRVCACEYACVWRSRCDRLRAATADASPAALKTNNWTRRATSVYGIRTACVRVMRVCVIVCMRARVCICVCGVPRAAVANSRPAALKTNKRTRGATSVYGIRTACVRVMRVCV